jgi:putative MATE family efflux protein
LQTMLGFVDLVFVGQLGPDAIAGVGLGNQLMMLLQVLFMGLAVGNTALVARAIGAKDRREAERIAKQALVIAVLLSVIIGVVGFLFADNIIRVMGATDDVNAIGSGFLRIVSTFSIVISVMLIGGGTLRGSGDTFSPMVITFCINLVNIFFDYSLIFGNFGFPRLGAVGDWRGVHLVRFVQTRLGFETSLARRLGFSPRRDWSHSEHWGAGGSGASRVSDRFSRFQRARDLPRHE